MISNFFDTPKTVTADRLASICGCQIVGNKQTKVNNVSTLKNAQFNELSFFGNMKYLGDLKKTNAGIVIMEEKYLEYLPAGATALLCHNVMAAYGRAVALLFPDPEIRSSIDSTAVIHETVKLGRNVQIGAYVVIEECAEIGDNCIIDSFSKIGRKVKLGSGCRISSNVSIDYAILGNNVSVHAGAKIGQPGFGIVPEGDHMVYIKQLGRVIIGNNVRVGANTTIDRGAVEDTMIGDNTIIDNLVQIAHNVKIGRMVTLVSQVGIAGSSSVDDGAVLAGQVGIAGHVHIGKGVIIAAKSGVASSVEDGKIIGGIPAVDIMTWKRQSVFLKKAVTKKDEV